MSPAEQVILVDGSSFLFRAYHAIREPLTTSAGQTTHAVFGTINMLRSLLKGALTDGVAPTRVAVVMDAKGKTFRHQMYADYKANRPPMPDDLRAQLAYVERIIPALGIALISVPGVEADDVIGTLATRASERGWRAMLVSSDKDLAQLVGERVEMVDTMKNLRLDVAGVTAKFGVPPQRMVEYLALMGDASDNIPGIPMVGAKTAAKWLDRFGSLAQIIARADEIKGKVGESLRANLKQLELSRQLATLRLDLELEVGLDDLKVREADAVALRALYTELEFNSWLKQLSSPSPSFPQSVERESTLAKRVKQAEGLPAFATSGNDGDGVGEKKKRFPLKDGGNDGGNDGGGDGGNNEGGVAEITAKNEPPTQYETILDNKSLARWIAKLRKAKLFALDTETTSLDAQRAELVGMSFSVRAGEAAYLPLQHGYAGAPAQLPLAATLAKLRPLLEDAKRAKTGQNIKYDLAVLRRHGIALDGVTHDTMLMSYLLDAGNSRHDLDALAMKHLGRRTIQFAEVAGSGKNQITFDQVHIEQAAQYAAEDADVTLQLHRALAPRLARDDALRELFERIEMPLIAVLARTEANGVKIDAAMLREQSAALATRLAEVETSAHAVAGEVFNIASPRQIQEILYDKQSIPVLRKTPKGQPSTAESVLQELAREHELPRLILQHRGLAKLKGTYTDKLPEMINPHTGRIHTSYHQAVAATGRLSSSDPNLQNIPIRSEEGGHIREAFIAEPGCVLVSADYSQIELRIMAHLSQDDGLINAFADRLDVHRATAAEVFGVAADEVDAEQRRRAKAINFGLIYGMSAFGLARQLRIEQKEARAYIEIYFARYPGVKRYMEQTKEHARERGYVETLYGRRLNLPEINSKNAARRQYAERTAINAPMQGSAADLIKLAMLEVDRWILDSGAAAKIIMQVHDELVLEVGEGESKQVAKEVAGLMGGVAELRVPLVVDTGVGGNWRDAH
ncbi:MAG: DNA polymerase I [bacterium]